MDPHKELYVGDRIITCIFSILAVEVLQNTKEARKGERREEAVNFISLKVRTWTLLKMAQQTQ